MIHGDFAMISYDWLWFITIHLDGIVEINNISMIDDDFVMTYHSASMMLLRVSTIRYDNHRRANVMNREES